ncbi:LamG domain-containing protein, partial [Pseudomonas indica]|uniref:LamG domain-containing protein n=1 Tax=Pseudomonas indica TaxID=137658 RepID=UPI000BD72124
LQGIYLSSRHEGVPSDTEETAPDFTRLIDTAPDFQDRGLLKTITKDDLRDTDIYVFRESNGQLVAERRGLHEDELYKNYSGVDEQDGAFRYTIQLRGSVENYYALSTYRGEANFTRWQSAGGFKEEFQRRTANHLKAGEVVRIIAINRPTGYMGSVKLQLQSATASGNLLNFPGQRIEMGPPNLKVWAERRNKIEAGMTRGEEKKHLIGNEGAGLGSDISIAIYSDWIDQDGSPLPEELGDYGYTGRLAKIVAANQLAPVGANNLSQFAIKPGRQVQVIHLPEKVLAKQHLYLQVAGQPSNRNPDFSSNGQASGILKYRPTHYVPVKVPLHDEEASELSRQAYRKAEKDNPDLELKKPEPLYAWQYRPELQFSLYELNVKEVRRIDAEDAGRNIYDDEKPILKSSDKYVAFMYDLLMSSLNTLEAWGYKGEREIVLTLGEEEVKVSAGEDQSIKFENLDHLFSLDADDFLSLRLTANNDAGNILWEFAYEAFHLEALNIGFKEEAASTYYLSADTPTLDLKATLMGYAGRDPEKKYPITARWTVEGDGQLAKVVQTDSGLGVFDNTLQMPTRAGATADVFVEMLDNPQSKTNWKKVIVEPGVPAKISYKVTGQAGALGQGNSRIDIDVFDQFGNRVVDETPVSVGLNDSLRIVSQQLATKNGHAYIEVTGGEFDVAQSEALISSGSVNVSANLSVQGLTVALSASTTQAKKGETVTLTAEVKRDDGEPATGVEVLFSAKRGVFEHPNQITNEQGIARASFIAGLNAQDDTWTVDVGYVASSNITFEVAPSPGRSIEAQDAMLVADDVGPGVVTYTEAGVAVQAAYETQGTVEVSSADAGIIQLGDMADPNLEPLLSIQMSSIESSAGGEQVFLDDVGLSPAEVSNVQIVRDHPMGGGRSAEFGVDSRAVVAADDLLNIADGFGLRLDLKPSSAGQVLSVNGQHQLHYSQNTLTYQADTDTGTYSVAVGNVAPDRWHSIALRMKNGEIELYVDGRTETSPYSGALASSNGAGLVVGGLQARIRGLRVYDWNSAPLVSFADGTFEGQVQSGNNRLAIKSLGNLGTRVSGSTVKQLRVALVSGTERNYVSLLSREGYVDIARQTMRTAPPEGMPIGGYQILPNPMGVFIPTAYAWTWEGVWEIAKEGVGLLIPYEDFITIGEQLYYWSTDDPRFKPTTLAFAAVGAATVIPVAKPLKPLLGPAKKFVEAMSRFPGAKHFAGAIGSAVKVGLSGNTKRLEQLLPFIQIGVALYEEPEAFDFLMGAIQSEDDLWVWAEYLATLAADAGGFGEEEVAMLNQPATWLVGNEGLVPYAHAAMTPRREVAQKLAKALSRVSRSVKDPKKFTPALKELLIVMKEQQGPIRKFLTNGAFLKSAMVMGAAKVRHFITSSKNWRVRREVIIFAVMYLSEEIAAGRLKIGEDKFSGLLADVISGRSYVQHGAIFQIAELLGYQLGAQFANGPEIFGIDTERQAFRLMYNRSSRSVETGGDKPYRRRVDIVLRNASGEEEWVELKSLSGPFKKQWFESRLTAKEKEQDSEGARDYYRQFFHDLRLNKKFVNENNLGDITGRQHQGNALFRWHFQDFKTKAASSVSPTKQDESLAQRLFCDKPSGLGDMVDFYKQNLAYDAGVTKRLCKSYVGTGVTLRDTKSYFEEYLVRYAKDLDIEDFIQIAREVGE